MEPTLTATGPWPEIIMRSFFIAGASSATSRNPFYGSWNRLLNTIFPPDTIFEVFPQYFPPSISSRNVIFLLIYVDASPVFIVEVKPPAEFGFNSKLRQEADGQMRQRFLDVVAELQIPVLHGVSAYGTKIAFYKYNRGSNVLEPRRITPDPETLTDTAPRDWWCQDILEEEGAAKFRQIVEEVKEMCAELQHVA